MCDVPLMVVPLSEPYNASLLQFNIKSMYGYRSGLQYFDLTGKIWNERYFGPLIYFIKKATEKDFIFIQLASMYIQ